MKIGKWPCFPLFEKIVDFVNLLTYIESENAKNIVGLMNAFQQIDGLDTSVTHLIDTCNNKYEHCQMKSFLYFVPTFTPNSELLPFCKIFLFIHSFFQEDEFSIFQQKGEFRWTRFFNYFL